MPFRTSSGKLYCFLNDSILSSVFMSLARQPVSKKPKGPKRKQV
jgi:hypothetical protein